MARHRPPAQDDGQVHSSHRDHRLYNEKCLACQRLIEKRNNDAELLLKITHKRPVGPSLLFQRDFNKTEEKNVKSYMAVWDKMSGHERAPYYKDYKRQYIEWKKKKSSVMAQQLDDTPPQVYATPGQEDLVDSQPKKQQNEQFWPEEMLQRADRLLKKLNDMKPCAWDEAVAQHRRVLRSSSHSANERIPSSVLAAAPLEATKKKKRRREDKSDEQIPARASCTASGAITRQQRLAAGRGGKARAWR